MAASFFNLYFFCRYSNDVITADKGNLGKLVVLEGEEPSDVIFAFCKKRGLHSHFRASLREAVCAAIACNRTYAVVWDRPISVLGEDLGTLVVTDEWEAADQVQKRCCRETAKS